MRRIAISLMLAVIAAGFVHSGAVLAAESSNETEDVLIIRFACLVGGRAAGSAPVSAGVLGREELSDFLLEWEPEADNREVRQVFALNDLGELARQAVQLPLRGGAVSGAYAHGDSTFEIDMNVRPARTIDSGDDVMTILAEIKRNGEVLSAPLIHSRLGERAIITTKNGPEAPFFFLVVEIDKLSLEDLHRRGLRHSWRQDYLLVDGDEVTVPKVVEKTAPVYPEEARKEKIQGRVVLRMVINAEGDVEDVEVVEGQPFGLSEAAVAAARTWRFEPALHEGKPVSVFYLVTIKFRLE